MRDDRLYSVESGKTHETIEKIIRVLYPDCATILDITWGRGSFWKGSARSVIGLDLDRYGRPSVVGDFTALPFRDLSIPLVAFDPPYIADASKQGTSVIGSRFGSYDSGQSARLTVIAGVQEAWRVAETGLIVKVSSHIHASEYVDMEGWIRDAIDQPLYGRVEQIRSSKIIGSNWTDQLSAWSNSATYLLYRRGSQKHIRRGGR